MKIIGKQDRDTFIVTAAAKELAQVAGVSWQGAIDAPHIDVGCTVNVGGMYTRLTALRNAAGQLASAQKTLRAVADLIDPIPPMIEAANEESDV